MTLLERQLSKKQQRIELEIRLGKRPSPNVLKFPVATAPSAKVIPIREEAPAPVVVPPVPVIHNDPARAAELDRLRDEVEDLKQHIATLIQDDEGPVFVPSPVKPIVRAVAKYYNTPLSRIVSMERMADVVRVRHVAMYLARKFSGRSMVAIGKVMMRDHSSITHGCQRVKERLERSEALQREIAELTAIIQAEVSNV